MSPEPSSILVPSVTIEYVVSFAVNDIGETSSDGKTFGMYSCCPNYRELLDASG